jgi:hypothetical protein
MQPPRMMVSVLAPGLYIELGTTAFRYGNTSPTSSRNSAMTWFLVGSAMQSVARLVVKPRSSSYSSLVIFLPCDQQTLQKESSRSMAIPALGVAEMKVRVTSLFGTTKKGGAGEDLRFHRLQNVPGMWLAG